MTHRTLVVAGLAALAACAPAHRPSAPAPRETVTAAPLPERTAGIEIAARVGEASAKAAARQADSVRVSMSEVTRQAVQVFGDSVVRDSSGADDAAEGEGEDAPSWDMDVQSYLSQDRVDHFVRMFSGPARTRIAERLERGTRYEPMIRQRMREGGLPEDMYYLALVESGFDPHAYSRAAAVGMWQFMTSTGRWMGMRIDWWVDERRDPIRSTTAAVRFLRGLREQFGSLYLAAAAYNGGPGRVARGLKRFEDELEGQEGEDLFFALAEQDYLRKETKDYVPQLIAAALVAKDPARYGMSFRTLPPFAYDSVVVGPESALPAIARAAGTTVTALHDLNPHLIRGMTPPRTDWTVRIPTGTSERFRATWASMDRAERTGLRREVTVKGSTLEGIAREHGVSVRQVLAFNPGGVKRSKKGRLVAGQTVLVPTAAVASAALVVPDPEIERYGSSTAASSARGRTRSVEMHVVRRGETLSGIAKKYRTTTARLQKLNRLRKPLIFPGQSLVVRGSLPETRVASARSRRSSSRVIQAGRAVEEDRPSRAATASSAKKATAGKSSKKTTVKKPGGRTAASTKASSRKASGSAKASTAKKSSAKRSATAKSSTKKASSSASAKQASAGGTAKKKKGAAPKDGARKK